MGCLNNYLGITFVAKQEILETKAALRNLRFVFMEVISMFV